MNVNSNQAQSVGIGLVSAQDASSVLGFNVTAVGNSISFEADGIEAFRHLDRHIFPSLPREPFCPNQADICIRLVQDPCASRLLIDGEEITHSTHSGDLLRELIDRLDRMLVERLTKLHAVHAGAVLIGDKALLLPGASHAGKSSLVAELLRRGAVCFSDEYALVDSQGWVHAYPRALLVRGNTDLQTALRAEECKSTVASVAAPVGWILALQYDRSVGWAVNPMSQSSALLTLLQNTPHVFSQRIEMLTAFRRAVENAECYVGHRGEASDAVDGIMQLVCSSSVSRTEHAFG